MSDKKPTLCIIAGPNGSGKTSTTRKLLQNEWAENSLYINPDDIDIINLLRMRRRPSLLLTEHIYTTIQLKMNYRNCCTERLWEKWLNNMLMKYPIGRVH